MRAEHGTPGLSGALAGRPCADRPPGAALSPSPPSGAGLATVRVMAPTTDDWVKRFAKELGTAPPDAVELDALLALAGTAAHASERTAAPVSCWLAARAGVAPAAALAAAERLATEFAKGAGTSE